MALTPHASLRLGFIGGGLNSAVGYTHFNASRLDGHFRVKSGCFSRQPAQNEQTAIAYGVPAERTYLDWKTLLANEKDALDAVVVLTPTPDHTDSRLRSSGRRLCGYLREVVGNLKCGVPSHRRIRLTQFELFCSHLQLFWLPHGSRITSADR